MNLSRRRFVLTGLIAAPAVVAFDHIMPVKMWKPTPPDVWGLPDDHYYYDFATDSGWIKENGVLRITKAVYAPRSYPYLNYYDEIDWKFNTIRSLGWSMPLKPEAGIYHVPPVRIK